ncbi:hypothetical protein CMUS01_05278 [Colletotrichum musicola]|uniref:Zn(2)-C6 fungal-type domain-containing protein n=1 Tax=Colletotrichum musicola TaxID=2175873 RepID=A0A8H6KTF0_9PEZI|nr:hypothetical protein CMUS01_05278 [Colletotrichum musicola]
MTGKGSRDRTGCKDCRRRKRGCDRKKPQCGSCQKHNVACVYVDPTQTSPSKYVHQFTKNHFTVPLDSAGSPTFVNLRSDEVALICQQYAGAADLAQRTPPRAPQSIVPNPRWAPVLDPKSGGSEMEMVQYYDEVISCSKVCVNDKRNVFRTFVLPVLLSNRGPLFDTVIALTAAEWARRGLRDGVDYNKAADQYKGEALAQLRSKAWVAGNAEENLLTCVLLASLDIAEGSLPSWLTHLRGALAIANTHSSRISPDCAALVLQYFRFRYVLMKTTQHKNLLESSDQPGESVSDQWDEALRALDKFLPGTSQTVDPQIGCSMELVELINKITAAGAAASGSTAKNSSTISPELDGATLEKRVRQLKSYATGPDSEYLLKSAECFRLATLIYLQLVLFNAPIRFPSMPVTSQPLLDCLSEIICEDQPRRCFPMWPLFIAGCVSCTDAHRKAVLDHFNLLDKKWPISNIATVTKAIQTIWQTRDFDNGIEPTTHRDWQDIIDKFGWKLSLS